MKLGESSPRTRVVSGNIVAKEQKQVHSGEQIPERPSGWSFPRMASVGPTVCLRIESPEAVCACPQPRWPHRATLPEFRRTLATREGYNEYSFSIESLNRWDFDSPTPDLSPERGVGKGLYRPSGSLNRTISSVRTLESILYRSLPTSAPQGYRGKHRSVNVSHHSKIHGHGVPSSADIPVERRVYPPYSPPLTAHTLAHV